MRLSPPPCPLRARSARIRPPERSRHLPAQLVGDSLLSLVTAVQIGHGRAGGGVPHTIHQLAQIRTRIRDKLVTGVPQIVKVDHREPGCIESWPPGSPSPKAATTTSWTAPRPGTIVIAMTVRLGDFRVARLRPRPGAPRSRSWICCLRCRCFVRVGSRCGGGRPGLVCWDPRGSRCRAGTRW